MTEEITQQSDAPVESQTTPDEPSEQTLEDIAKKYSIEDQTKSFTAQPVQQAPSQPAPSYEPQYRVPDPVVNQDEFTRFLAQQNSQVNNNLREIAQTVTEMRKQQEQERLNAEVNKAVERVNTKLNIDPKYAEILLEKEYRDNKIFQRIWENRYANPKALDEALDVIANSATRVFQVKSDPQLVENQRAAKASQKTMASTSKQSPNADVMDMNEQEFNQWWNRNRGF